MLFRREISKNRSTFFHRPKNTNFPEFVTFYVALRTFVTSDTNPPTQIKSQLKMHEPRRRPQPSNNQFQHAPATLPSPSAIIRSRTDPEDFLQHFEETAHSREWVSINNLDSFFEQVYHYHNMKGFWSIVVTWISNIINVAFTIAFSVFLVGCVNWSFVLSCSNVEVKRLLPVLLAFWTSPSRSRSRGRGRGVWTVRTTRRPLFSTLTPSQKHFFLSSSSRAQYHKHSTNHNRATPQKTLDKFVTPPSQVIEAN